MNNNCYNLLISKVDEVLMGKIDYCSLRVYGICYDFKHGRSIAKTDYNFMIRFLFGQQDIWEELLK